MEMPSLKLIFVALLCAPLLYLAVSFSVKLLGGMLEGRKRAGL
jgi:hypothetical protein